MSDLLERIELPVGGPEGVRLSANRSDADNTPAITPISERVLHSDRYMERVTTDLEGFLLRYFDFPNDGYKPEHVYRALRIMFGGGRWVFPWATDHAKSKTGDFFFPIASLASDPDASHILMGANLPDAKRRLQTVAREFETNHQLLADFPWLKKPIKPRNSSGGITWSRTELTVAGRSVNKPDPSLYACTTGSDDVRGRRGKLIMDDIEGKQNSRRATERQKLYEFVKFEAVRCLEDPRESSRALVVAMGTPFDIDSIYIKLEGEGWDVLKVPAYTMPIGKVSAYAFMKLPDGTQSNRRTPWQVRGEMMPDKLFTWPRKRFKVLENDPWFGAKMTRRQFYISYLLDASGGDHSRLSLQEMRKLVESVELPTDDHWTTAVSLDPAGGVDQDYAGISVVRIRWPSDDKFPHVEVLECLRFEGGLFEQVKQVADLCWEYGDGTTPLRLVYENNGQQGPTYKNAFGHMRPEITLVPIYTSDRSKFDKEMGLTVIRTLVRQKRLKIAEEKLDSEGAHSFLVEVRDLGSTDDDHIAASIWFVVRWLYDQVRFYNGPKLVTAASGRVGWGAGIIRAGGPGAPPSWRTWRKQ